MSLKKQFLKSKDICKVTFRISADEGGDSEKAALLGSFNNWEPEPMTRLKNGSYKLTKDLETGANHSFRYLLDEDNWLNDSEADKSEATHFPDAENSVISL